MLVIKYTEDKGTLCIPIEDLLGLVDKTSHLNSVELRSKRKIYKVQVCGKNFNNYIAHCLATTCNPLAMISNSR